MKRLFLLLGVLTLCFCALIIYERCREYTTKVYTIRTQYFRDTQRGKEFAKVLAIDENASYTEEIPYDKTVNPPVSEADIGKIKQKAFRHGLFVFIDKIVVQDSNTVYTVSVSRNGVQNMIYYNREGKEWNRNGIGRAFAEKLR